MHILLVNSLYTPNFLGGAEKSVQSLAEALVESGHKITVLTTGPKNKIETINGVKVIYVKINNFYWLYNSRNKPKWVKALWHIIDSYNFLETGRFKQLLKEINPDIVHTNNLAGISTSIWNVVKSEKIKLVHTSRDYYLLCPKATMFRNGQICRKQCKICFFLSYNKKNQSKKVDAYIGISQYILNLHLNYNFFNRAKITAIIRNAVNPLGSKSFESNQIRNIGFIGRIEKAKGIELLLEAFTRVNSRYSDLELKIAGRGENDYLGHLKRKYPNSRIHFNGYVNAIDFMEHLDLLVVPSQWHEPFGRVIIEAQSIGLKVIGSRVGGIPELLLRSHTFEPKVEDLEHMIYDIIKGNLAFPKIDPKVLINLETLAKEYTRIYEEISER